MEKILTTDMNAPERQNQRNIYSKCTITEIYENSNIYLKCSTIKNIQNVKMCNHQNI